MELLTAREVALQLKLSSRQVWKLAGSGRMPEPIRVGGSRCVRWRATDIALFVECDCSMTQFEAARAATGGAKC